MSLVVLLFFIACALITATHVVLVYSAWHRDGVIGKLTLGAVGIIAAVPPMTYAYVGADDAQRYVQLDPFAHWIVVAFAANAMWRAARTILDRRQVLRRVPNAQPDLIRIIPLDG